MGEIRVIVGDRQQTCDKIVEKVKSFDSSICILQAVWKLGLLNQFNVLRIAKKARRKVPKFPRRSSVPRYLHPPSILEIFHTLFYSPAFCLSVIITRST